MPMTLTVGLARKIGEANYGSRGASANLELELDSSLASEPNRLQDRIRQLFDLVRSSVEQELNGTGYANGLTSNNGHTKNSTASGNGAGHRPLSPAPRPATATQINAINAIAHRQRADLPLVLQNGFQLTRLEDLSIRQASDLIDTLKSSSGR